MIQNTIEDLSVNEFIQFNEKIDRLLHLLKDFRTTSPEEKAPQVGV